MKIREIMGALEQFAPLSLQDSYDNAGLQIGLTEDADVSGALLSLDVTEDVVDEAERLGCNLILSHHPLLFHPLKQIIQYDSLGRIVLKTIRKGIAIYSAHTNLDNAYGGVSYEMAARLGLKDVQTLQPSISARMGKDDGAGVIGSLNEPLSSNDFLNLVKQTFLLPCLRYTELSDKNRLISRVALCGGAGAFLIPKAVQQKADAYITGEIGYHRFFGYENNILLAEIGHFESERYTVDLLMSILKPIVENQFPIYIYPESNPTSIF